jgi:predicted metal-dependent HD superfamily phosphohydrolase
MIGSNSRMNGDPSVNLRQRFTEMWNRCLLPGAEASSGEIFDDLVKRYREPHRRYHGWAHVKHCLTQFDLAASAMKSPDAVEMALWFHDAVYLPGGQDNERDSAALFQAAAAGPQPNAYVQTVCDYILLTRHQEVPIDADGCFVVDIDLSPLGVRWTDYLRDSENIRWEAPQVSDDVFFRAQAAFLKAMLARPQIFRTDLFFLRYEAVARENMTAFIERLQAAGYS